jgi:methionyl-tRNA formyltransferase
MRIVIFGNGNPLKMVVTALRNEQIDIVGVQQDKEYKGEAQSDVETFMDQHRIPLNQVNKLLPSDFDMLFVVNYNQIIPVGQYPGKKLVNLHMGLLPQYRGNNANGWAVINGEDNVGYSVHEMTAVLDGGDIFYRFEYNRQQDCSYLEAKRAIEQDISQNIGKVLLAIYHNQLPPVSQTGSRFTYCSKLRPSDGIIRDWNQETILFIRKQYVFGKPLGTGLKFLFKDKLYEIGQMSIIEDYLPSIGVPGGIIYIRDNAIWIKTKDTAVEAHEITAAGQPVDVNQVFKIGMRLS